jgi:hypothetical protein
MGANCCGGDEKQNKDTNLMRQGGRYVSNKDYLNKVPIMLVIRAQALIRGFLARNKVKKIYGY